MKKTIRLVPLAAALAAAMLAPPGCSSRTETPEAGKNGTTVFRSKEPGAPEASIAFCRKVGRKSGKPIGAGTVFTMGKKAKVRALIDVEKTLAYAPRDLMFHVVWVGPDGNSIYRKRVDHSPEEGSIRIQSAISIPPDRRRPGIYTLRVYLFRERIAEKQFELRAEESAS